MCEECQPCDFAVTHLGHVTRPYARDCGQAASQLRNHCEILRGGEGSQLSPRAYLEAKSFTNVNSLVFS